LSARSHLNLRHFVKLAPLTLGSIWFQIFSLGIPCDHRTPHPNP
jgi:hypothetical protein